MYLVGEQSIHNTIDAAGCDQAFGPGNLALKKLLGQMWAESYDFTTKDRSEITFATIPRLQFYLKVQFTGGINFLVEK